MIKFIKKISILLILIPIFFIFLIICSFDQEEDPMNQLADY